MPTPSAFQLLHINGHNGFRLDGASPYLESGEAVASAGDVNGDGFSDVIVGVDRTSPNGVGAAGTSYVVFGTDSGFERSLSLGDLDGSNGFRLDGVGFMYFSGGSVASAGDVNGDGFSDIIIGAQHADPNGQRNAGESYVVFGTDAGFAPILSLGDLDGNNGFRLDGIERNDSSGHRVASAGDVNGDGFDDILISARGAGGGYGASYVIFGTDAGFAPVSSLADLNGSNGFRLEGIGNHDFSGDSVASAGDFNGDGFDDIIIGASAAEADGQGTFTGESYLVFGKASGFAPVQSLGDLDGSNGFRLAGLDRFDYSGGFVASAGDINGDGFDDILIGAPGAAPDGLLYAGESYVVFGTNAQLGPNLSLSDLNGSNGFRIDGAEQDDQSGRVASAGDVNGDGFDDILVTASNADPNEKNKAGESYVVFGTDAGFAPTLSLGDLDGSNGFRLQGVDERDFSGVSAASAGDVNGDGYDDLIIGATGANADGTKLAGESYIVFGAATGFVMSVVNGTDANDWLGLPADWHLGLKVIDGGAGVDMMSFAGLDSGIYASTQSGRANSHYSASPFDLVMQGIEHVTGTSHDDWFAGSDQSDNFRGLGGKDLFVDGGGGSDIYDGGTGHDKLSYLGAESGVSVSLLRGTGWMGDARGDQIRAIEDVSGSGHDDFIWGDHGVNWLNGRWGDDVLVGNGGNDVLIGDAGTDTAIYGGNRADYTITGDGSRAEVTALNSDEGHDILIDIEILRFADGDLIL
jgi:hypothetical protein